MVKKMKELGWLFDIDIKKLRKDYIGIRFIE